MKACVDDIVPDEELKNRRGKSKTNNIISFFYLSSMKSGIVGLFFLLAFFKCFSQNAKETFLNEVSKDIFITPGTIYLAPGASGVFKTFWSKGFKKEEFGDIAPIDVVNELYNKAGDTTIEYWNCQNIRGAECISPPAFRSKAKTERLYFVSKPMFSNDQSWCLVSVRVYTEYPWAEVYLFHRINGKWKKYRVTSWQA